MSPPDLRPFVVTGCARSGTTYMAHLLSGLGLRLGHEVVFGPRTRGFHGWRGLNGDSSWLAAPFLGELDEALVFHQVRHPLRVARSLVGIGFFAERTRLSLLGDDLYTRAKWKARERLMAAGHVEHSDKGPRPHQVYRTFIDTYAPQLWDPPTEPERALRYWLDWTRMIVAGSKPNAYAAHHVELLDEDAVSGMLDKIGLPVTPGHVALAMSKVPKDTNSIRIAPLEWADLPATPLRREAETYAEELGYVAHDPSILPWATHQ